MDIKTLYTIITKQDKLNEDYAIVFVYNDASKIDDLLHCSECISVEEKNMIVQSFEKSARSVYAIPAEEIFMEQIEAIKARHKYLFVYSMAQNITGAGRRSLIPLLCNHHHIINMGSSFLESTLGGTKKIMHSLLQHNDKINLPETLFIESKDEIPSILQNLSYDRYVIKPNDESASIGVHYKNYTLNDKKDFLQFLLEYSDDYPNFCIQKFIPGDEVEVLLLFYHNSFYCPGVCKIINNEGPILDYDTIQADCYGFCEYDGSVSDSIIEMSKTVATILGFKTMCRVDFKIHNDVPYVIDIGANPTVSYHSSSNFMLRERLGDKTAVYRLLLYKALEENGLFKPSFD